MTAVREKPHYPGCRQRKLTLPRLQSERLTLYMLQSDETHTLYRLHCIMLTNIQLHM